MHKKEGVIRQPDLFLENDPELKRKSEKVNFRVSILGGKSGEQDADELGYELTKDFFSIQTGGYNRGAMKSGLEGADRALKEMKEDAQTKRILGHICPTPKGIGMERISPDEVFKGEHPHSELLGGGVMDHYLRLGKLIEESSANIVLAGGTGTEVEFLADFRFNKQMYKKQVEGFSHKPLIFVGDHHDSILKDKFGSEINKSDFVYKTDTAKEAVELVKVLELLENTEEELKDDELERLKEFKRSHLLRI